jgi:hypothetical protein
VVLNGDSAKFRGINTFIGIIHSYHKWVTGNMHYVTYWWHDSVLSSHFVYIWGYWWVLVGILMYSMETVLSVKASKLLVASSTVTIWTSWLQWTIIRWHIRVRVFYFLPILWRFENIGDNLKCKGFIIARTILYNYHTHKLATGSNH